MVLLTVLVAADVTVESAQENLAASALNSQLEARESLLDAALEGAAALDVVAQVQTYLANNPAPCASLPQYLASATGATTIAGEDSGVRYSVDADASQALPATGPIADNLTLSPFSGYVPGALDLRLQLEIDEVGGGGSVTLHKRVTHLLNVEISPGSAGSLCSSAAVSLEATLSRFPCNATLEEAAFELVLPGLESSASALGFSLTAGLGWVGACTVAYWFTLVEPGVAGVTGTFDWTARGSGTV